MPKLKLTDDDIDVDELEEAEYSDQDFTDYDGPEPEPGDILPGFIKKVWWTWTANDAPMLKVLFEADDTAGEFEGCPMWDNLALIKEAKFRWQPWMDVMGLNIRTVKSKTFYDGEDNIGAVVTKIGTWEPGPDNDYAYCRVVVGRHRFDGRWQLDVKKYLDYEPGDADEPNEEAEQGGGRHGSRSTPDRSKSRRQEPERPGRSSRRTRAEEPDEDEEDAPPARSARRSGSATRGSRSAPARRGARSRSADDDQEPPF